MYGANLLSAMKHLTLKNPLQNAHCRMTIRLPDACNIACIMCCSTWQLFLVFGVRQCLSQILEVDEATKMSTYYTISIITKVLNMMPFLLSDQFLYWERYITLALCIKRFWRQHIADVRIYLHVKIYRWSRTPYQNTLILHVFLSNHVTTTGRV